MPYYRSYGVFNPTLFQGNLALTRQFTLQSLNFKTKCDWTLWVSFFNLQQHSYHSLKAFKTLHVIAQAMPECAFA